MELLHGSTGGSIAAHQVDRSAWGVWSENPGCGLARTQAFTGCVRAATTITRARGSGGVLRLSLAPCASKSDPRSRCAPRVGQNTGTRGYAYVQPPRDPHESQSPSWEAKPGFARISFAPFDGAQLEEEYVREGANVHKGLAIACHIP